MRRFSTMLAALVVLSTAVVALLPTGVVTGQGPALQDAATQAGVDSPSVYLPTIARGYPRLANATGVQMHAINESQGLSSLAATSAYFVRYNAFDWNAIEPVRTDPPTYVWAAVDEASLLNAARRGLQVIATVKYTPSWAQKWRGTVCGPASAEYFDEYAQFLTALVQRYGAAPYNIRYWELGNEVDIAPEAVPANSGYGCWGDRNDPYYGGRYYGQMLQTAYPAIKAADPRAQVLIGGLLLGAECTSESDLCTASRRFFEGILVAGGGPYFDIVSYHGYNLYNGTLRFDVQYMPFWRDRGGIALGKASFLRGVLSAYGLSKPLMHTEGSLVCKEDFAACRVVGEAFYQAQADYVVWLYVRNWAAGISATIWYDMKDGGWRYSGLLDPSGAERPSYAAFDFLTEELGVATYTGPVTQFVGIEGYAFATPEGRVWVLWAPDEVAHTVDLPSGTIRVLDKYGTEIAGSSGAISVSSPVYVELVP